MPNLKNKRGQGLIEYIMVVVLMGIMALAVVKKLGEKTQKGFTKATNELSSELGV